MSSPSQRIAAALRVRAGEGERVALMLLFSLLAVGGVVITGQLAGRALFLAALPVELIPLRFILPPLALVATVTVYTRYAGNVHQPRLMRITLAGLAAGCLVFRLLLGTPVAGELAVLLALFVFLDVAGSLAMVLFWTLAGDIFHARQARRLFGLISGGSALSNIAFGAVLGNVADRVPPENLLLVVSASLLGSLWIVGYLGARYHHEAPPAPGRRREERSPAGPGWRDRLRVGAALGSPLMGTIAAIVIVVALVSNIADFQLDLVLKARFESDGRGMVGFLATFRLWAGIVAAFVQFGLAGFLMDRFGASAALLALPATVGLGGAAVVITGGQLWAVAIPKAADVALKYTVHDSAMNILYLPLEARRRARAKALVEGVLKPPLVAGLGVVFLAVTRYTTAGPVTWSVAMLALIGLWIWLARRAASQYVDELAASIVMRRLDPSIDTVPLDDEASVRVLREALASEDPMRVIHTLTLVASVEDVDWTPQLLPLLQRSQAEVRSAALELIGSTKAAETTDAVRRHRSDPSPSVRAAAVAALARLDGHSAVDEMSSHLEDESAEVRRAAILSLIRFGGLGGVLRAGGPLNALLEAEDPARRAEGARLLGELEVPGFHASLIELLRDPDPSVRLAAVRASGRLAVPDLVAGLHGALTEPALQSDAARAVLACCSEDATLLAQIVADRSLPRSARLQLLRGASREPQTFVPVLASLLADDDQHVRTLACDLLLKARDAGCEVDLDAVGLDDRIAAEVDVACRRLRLTTDLGEELNPLLAEALGAAADADRRRIMLLLGLRHEGLPARALISGVEGDDARTRANALELVDNLGAVVPTALMPVLEGSRERVLAAAELAASPGDQAPATRLTELLEDPDPWLRACALEEIRALRQVDFVERVEERVHDDDPGVREMARATRLALRDREHPEETMALAPLEKVLFLKQVPLFREIPGDEVQSLLPIVQDVEFAAGDEIITQGDEGDCLYVLVEGDVEIRIGDTVIDKVFTSRDVIGELAIVTGDRRAATCTARTEVRALKIDRDDFRDLLHERPEVTIGVMQMLASYLRQSREESGS